MQHSAGHWPLERARVGEAMDTEARAPDQVQSPQNQEENSFLLATSLQCPLLTKLKMQLPGKEKHVEGPDPLSQSRQGV